MAQRTLDAMVDKENVLLAVIRWVLKVVQSRYSQHSSYDITELFKVIFSGHKIIQKFSYRRTKCGCNMWKKICLSLITIGI